jgi:uncharacterized membrane protein YesL
VTHELDPKRASRTVDNSESRRAGGARGDGPPPSEILRRTFKRFFWNSYDHMGLLVLANLLWLALCLPIVTAPASTAALLHLGRRIARQEEVTLHDFLAGFRLHFVPALKAGVFDATIGFLLWVNFDFYAHLGGHAALVGALLAALMIWIAGFLVFMHAHVFPLIAEGERSLRAVLRKAALLTLDNPAFTFGITLQTLSVAVLCILTGVGLFLALGSLTAVLLATGQRELLKRYFPESPEAAESDETRGFLDLIRPWESGRPR